ncbi:hypothetical protein D5R81_13220 [Parashewanella spongiae]|uniref:Uncharacterized protein n=1 Tax=Parashewanella spongiae TaxID=342950 RepID=A0A3A6TS51_9GAMM|nr:hypothetical protein [Parashewanella spongiae]MCL1079058.1 hypothetical protein [Parashewanella spongiae]RJY11410.1 hypothetical protein D5R81_13220 [Parashewanella spongiae]
MSAETSIAPKQSPTLARQVYNAMPSGKTIVQTALTAGVGLATGGPAGAAVGLAYQVAIKPKADEVIDFIAKKTVDCLPDKVKESTVGKYTTSGIKTALQGTFAGALAPQGLVHGAITGTSGILASKGAVAVSNSVQDKLDVPKDSYLRCITNFFVGTTAGYGGTKLAGTALDYASAPTVENDEGYVSDDESDIKQPENTLLIEKHDDSPLKANHKAPINDDTLEGLLTNPKQVDIRDGPPDNSHNPSRMGGGRNILSVNENPKMNEPPRQHPRVSRDAENCVDMGRGVNRRKWFVPLGRDDNRGAIKPLGGVEECSVRNTVNNQGIVGLAPAKIKSTGCVPIFEILQIRGASSTTDSIPSYMEGCTPVFVNCNGGGHGVKFRQGTSFKQFHATPVNVSNQCVPPDAKAYDCNSALILPFGSVINTTDIPSEFNQALSPNSNVMVRTPNNNILVPWSMFYQKVREKNPHARCEGNNQGQPNTEFLTITDYNQAYNDIVSNCTTASMDASNGVLHLDDITIDVLGQALVESSANPPMVTDGFVSIPWVTFERRLQSSAASRGICSDSSRYPGSINSRTLTRRFLRRAFRTCDSPVVLNDAQYHPISVEDIGNITDSRGLNIPDDALVSAGGNHISYWRDVKPLLSECHLESRGIKKVGVEQMRQAIINAPKALDRICFVDNRKTPIIYGNVVHADDLSTAFQNGSAVELAPNDIVFNGEKHVLWQDVSRGFNYEDSACVRDRNAWRNVSRDTLFKSIEQAPRASFAERECSFQVDFLNSTEVIEVNNISQIFVQSYPQWSTTGLAINSNQEIMHEDRVYLWRDIAPFLPEQNTCEQSLETVDGELNAYKGVTESTLISAINRYRQSLVLDVVEKYGLPAGVAVGATSLIGCTIFGTCIVTRRQAKKAIYKLKKEVSAETNGALRLSEQEAKYILLQHKTDKKMDFKAITEEVKVLRKAGGTSNVKALFAVGESVEVLCLTGSKITGASVVARGTIDHIDTANKKAFICTSSGKVKEFDLTAVRKASVAVKSRSVKSGVDKEKWVDLEMVSTKPPVMPKPPESAQKSTPKASTTPPNKEKKLEPAITFRKGEAVTVVTKTNILGDTLTSATVVKNKGNKVVVRLKGDNLDKEFDKSIVRKQADPKAEASRLPAKKDAASDVPKNPITKQLESGAKATPKASATSSTTAKKLEPAITFRKGDTVNVVTKKSMFGDTVTSATVVKVNGDKIVVRLKGDKEDKEFEKSLVNKQAVPKAEAPKPSVKKEVETEVEKDVSKMPITKQPESVEKTIPKVSAAPSTTGNKHEPAITFRKGETVNVVTKKNMFGNTVTSATFVKVKGDIVVVRLKGDKEDKEFEKSSVSKLVSPKVEASKLEIPKPAVKKEAAKGVTKEVIKQPETVTKATHKPSAILSAAIKSPEPQVTFQKGEKVNVVIKKGTFWNTVTAATFVKVNKGDKIEVRLEGDKDVKEFDKSAVSKLG